MGDGMITEFVIVRHGETSSNADGIIQGHLQTELNERGLYQAHLAGKALADESFDRIVCSDLFRALKTAQIIAEENIHKGIPLQTTPELREWFLGDFQGKTVDEINQKYPHVLDAFRYAGEDFAIPGGERRSEFYARVHHCLDRLAEEYAGKKILLVTHGGCLKAVFQQVVASPGTGAMLPMTNNASICRVFRRDDKWQLNTWNESSHLKESSVRETATF